ncbi:MAG TPA: response regulator [Pyrinomonadaceae bacterium]|nr:response regulator [Pyrinomonadaceae bacterium]
MLAGRKLLLADDSVTIQKVIDLTFADEGVEVITVGDGEEAIEKVEELLPDVVLADVFMPIFNGYEVCEYIKGSEKLKHIPVMLLVGSFEPFDEAEARRVGANDTLTKPFQSIRRLIEKVGDLVSGKPPESEVPTAELPQEETPKEPTLSTEELEIVTADTMQLPADLHDQAHQFVAEHQALQPALNETKMESQSNEAHNVNAESNDALLDLEDFEPAEAVADDDDFELELDLDEPQVTPAPVYSSVSEPPGAVAPALVRWEEPFRVSTTTPREEVAMNREPVAEQVNFEERSYAPVESRPFTTAAEVPPGPAPITADNLSPEMIDAIARRAVAYMSEKVVREIAWEVVPQLAELLIKRQLEEKESQPK